MTTFARRSNVITQTRQAATQLLEAYEKLLALKITWDNAVKNQIVDANDSNPETPGYDANDFVGHEGLMKADINQALGTALTALTAFVTSADGKKLEDIRN